MDLTDPDATFFRELKATKMFPYTVFNGKVPTYIMFLQPNYSENLKITWTFYFSALFRIFLGLEQ